MPTRNKYQLYILTSNIWYCSLSACSLFSTLPLYSIKRVDLCHHGQNFITCYLTQWK